MINLNYYSDIEFFNNLGLCFNENARCMFDEFLSNPYVHNFHQVPSLLERKDYFNRLAWLKNEKVCNAMYERYSRLKDNYQDIYDFLKYMDINCFYHFTNAQNYHSIIKYGGLFSRKFIVDNGIESSCSFGGNDLSYKIDTERGMSDYVRLSFCKNHPMQYRLKLEHQNLILLQIKPEVALLESTMFSDCNAASAKAILGSDLNFLGNMVDILATAQDYVSKNSPIFDGHQAEVMVKTFIPIDYITFPPELE